MEIHADKLIQVLQERLSNATVDAAMQAARAMTAESELAKLKTQLKPEGDKPAEAAQ